MKSVSFIFVVLMMVSAQAYAFTDASNEKINQAISIALNPNLDSILAQNSGSTTCQPHYEPFAWPGYVAKAPAARLKASGKNQEFAQTWSQLKCMREACELLPGATNAKAEELSQDDAQLLETLQFLGYDESQAAALMGKKAKGAGQPLSCLTNQTMRTMAYTLCVTTVYSCQ